MLQRARHLTHQDHRSRLPLGQAMFALDSRFHVIQFASILSPFQTRWVTLYVTFWCIVESRCGARVNLDFGVSRADIRSQSERRGGQKETSCKNVQKRTQKHTSNLLLWRSFNSPLGALLVPVLFAFSLYLYYTLHSTLGANIFRMF